MHWNFSSFPFLNFYIFPKFQQDEFFFSYSFKIICNFVDDLRFGRYCKPASPSIFNIFPFLRVIEKFMPPDWQLSLSVCLYPLSISKPESGMTTLFLIAPNRMFTSPELLTLGLKHFQHSFCPSVVFITLMLNVSHLFWGYFFSCFFLFLPRF